MPNYQNGKIYKIVSKCSDKVYIGSTTSKYLSTRLAGHRQTYRKWLDNKFEYLTSFELMKEDHCEIVLLENCPCNNINELMARERYYIEKLDCVNKIIPGRTGKEYREQNKERISIRCKKYRESNKERMRQKDKHYYQQNKEKITDYVRQYREQNKERIAKRCKEYNEKNRDKFKAIRSLKYKCECGREVLKYGKNRHNKARTHIDYLNSLK